MDPGIYQCPDCRHGPSGYRFLGFDARKLNPSRLTQIATWIVDASRFSLLDQIKRPLTGKPGPHWKRDRLASRDTEIEFTKSQLIDDANFQRVRSFLVTERHRSTEILSIASWSYWNAKDKFEPVDGLLARDIEPCEAAPRRSPDPDFNRDSWRGYRQKAHWLRDYFLRLLVKEAIQLDDIVLKPEIQYMPKRPEIKSAISRAFVHFGLEMAAKRDMAIIAILPLIRKDLMQAFQDMGFQPAGRRRCVRPLLSYFIIEQGFRFPEDATAQKMLARPIGLEINTLLFHSTMEKTAQILHTIHAMEKELKALAKPLASATEFYQQPEKSEYLKMLMEDESRHDDNREAYGTQFFDDAMAAMDHESYDKEEQTQSQDIEEEEVADQW
ncbi:hypothetical protein F4778DRAFT_799881 [Xylariomycetidae sp. FL2044]|nr:hypothetical protein F4778DRAFT_799881 [Xylariomycetidae sp. FL2044]